MIQMALNGEGEPRPTLLQVATQAAMIELFTQWQTYVNGVHWDYDSFRSVDFRAIAVAVLTAAGFEVKALDVTLQLPTLGDDLNATVRPFAEDSLDNVTLAGTTRGTQTPGQTEVAARVATAKQRNAETDVAMQRPYSLSAEAIAEHGKQVQG